MTLITVDETKIHFERSYLVKDMNDLSTEVRELQNNSWVPVAIKTLVQAMTESSYKISTIAF